MRLFVETMAGKTITVEIEGNPRRPEDLILIVEVREELWVPEAFPRFHQQLMFGDHVLDDGRTRALQRTE